MPGPLVLRKDGQVVADPIVPARRVRERVRGLLGTDELSRGHALLLEPARQVHTFGMRYPIDLIFCDPSWRVVRVLRSVPPNRLTRFVLKARRVVELPAGGAEMIREGDRLVLGHSEERDR